MSRIKAEQDENIQTAQAEIERITSWRDEENGKLERSISFFEGLLYEYFVQLRGDDPKLKTMKLAARDTEDAGATGRSMSMTNPSCCHGQRKTCLRR